jgi:transketolase
VIPYGGTFLVFSDYMRPAIRLASISGIKVIYVFTHDSVGLGEDGPTHQPTEHIASLRAIPKIMDIRPADANETVKAWQIALEHEGSPVALFLTRQKLPVIDRTKYADSDNLKMGAYIIKDARNDPDVILMAAGSEVGITLEAAEKLEGSNIRARVVSFPSWELFEKQTADYKEKVFPSSVKARVSVEAGVKQGWEKYVGDHGDCISIEKFGASAPYQTIFDNYGFTADNIVATAKDVLKKVKQTIE